VAVARMRIAPYLFCAIGFFVSPAQADWLDDVEKKSRERDPVERKQRQSIQKRFTDDARSTATTCRSLKARARFTAGAIEQLSRIYRADPKKIRINRVVFERGSCLAVIYHPRGVGVCSISPSEVFGKYVRGVRSCK